MLGKREDRHFAWVRRALAERGFALSWCLFIGDDPDLITATLRRTFAGSDIVFCFGGIGATPDDRTRQCAAKAAGVELYRHPEAVAEIEAQFGQAAHPLRVLMAELPRGSTIIPNPVNRVAGFSLHRHHFVPGFPEMAQPMLEALLDGEYAALPRNACESERAIVVVGAYESLLLGLMNECVARFPCARLFSLPTMATTASGRLIELGVRGGAGEVDSAIDYLKRGVGELGFEWRDAEKK